MLANTINIVKVTFILVRIPFQVVIWKLDPIQWLLFNFYQIGDNFSV